MTGSCSWKMYSWQICCWTICWWQLFACSLATFRERRHHLVRVLVLKVLLSVVCFMSGCAHHSVREEALRNIEQLTDAWDSQSSIHQDLSNLPPPAGLVAVAVFSFRDQSGQYKPAPANAFSTAVSQGGTAMLIEALSDSGWFLTLEREGLQNLLTERKIIRARRGETAVPPLQGANILIEGGVIGYDSNIKTGGAGAKYLGIGGDEKYRVDALTINLRAVDTANGAVIHTVNVSKTIISHAISASVFRFVKFKRLLEAEAGMTENEPAQLILKDAIDTAVIRLILVGLAEGSWQLKDYRDLKDPRLFDYATPDLRTILLTQHDRVVEQVARQRTAPKATGPAATPQARPRTEAPLSAASQPGATQQKEIPKQKAGLGVANAGVSASPPRPSSESSDEKSAEDYSIQLAASDDVQVLTKLTQQWGLRAELVRILKVRDFKSGSEREWYTLQLGSFNSNREAQSALESLPVPLRSLEPWVTQRAQQFEVVPAAPVAPVGSPSNPAQVGQPAPSVPLRVR